MAPRKKMVALSESEYRTLVKARGKYEHDTGERADGFGELIMFLGGLYLAGKFVESLEGRKKLKKG